MKGMARSEFEVEHSRSMRSSVSSRLDPNASPDLYQIVKKPVSRTEVSEVSCCSLLCTLALPAWLGSLV